MDDQHNISHYRISFYRASWCALCAGCGYVLVETLGLPALASLTLTAFVSALCRDYAWEGAATLFPYRTGSEQANTERFGSWSKRV